MGNNSSSESSSTSTNGRCGISDYMNTCAIGANENIIGGMAGGAAVGRVGGGPGIIGGAIIGGVAAGATGCTNNIVKKAKDCHK